MYHWQIPPQEQVIALTLPYAVGMMRFAEVLRQAAQSQPDLHIIGYSSGWAKERVAHYIATPEPAIVMPLLETLCALHQRAYPDEAPTLVMLGAGCQTLAQPTRQTGRYVRQNSEPAHYGIVTLHFAPEMMSGAVTLDVQPLQTSPTWRDLPDRQRYEDQLFACLMHWALGGVPETLLAGLHVTAEAARYHDVDSSLRDFYVATRLACDMALQAVGTTPAFP